MRMFVTAVRLVAATFATFALPVSGLAAPVLQSISNPSFVGRAPGADRFIGTADDITIAGGNPSGSACYVEFNGVSPIAGSDFFAFLSGTLTIEQPLVVSGQSVAIDDFSISFVASQTNGFVSTVVDVPSSLPHSIVLQAPGVWQASYALSSVIPFGNLDSRVSLSGYTIVPGVNPSLLPGIDTPTADYLAFLTGIAPADWTAISLAVAQPTLMTNANVSGTLAPFFVGGTARSVTAFVTTDSLLLIPEPHAMWLSLLGLGILSARYKRSRTTGGAYEEQNR